ncbi:MAG: hypothetical protein A2408_01420 [Candidatus Yonathbacteria bacterium RIFOXYC1_FULL_52_10]|uniref:Uncharacterized protein n=1 Tax=Candidatus Yonathbacteria bacterium RIFOXYD1_FULL_52_36 TaxID=1802730 RepID=A0A1G2SJV7_9BACT|nr:MAG: hypothetical protein A2591_01065 [Candidatus Yonathbacteria bacterium RIFOXYD1_FULL_52_36]OHA85548.1 MAG: hypothetical protein A2408_01420 [Candidatus Yonathbacteria bacterium RIFOXYC1_FULL_52_10]
MNEIATANGRAKAEQMLRGLGRAWIRCTLTQPGDPVDPVRFEATLHGILETKKLPTGFESCVGLTFDRTVESRFGLWKDKTIFFDPSWRIWIGHATSLEHAELFQVEVPGLIYNYRDYFDPSSWYPGATWHDDPIPNSMYDRYDRSGVMDALGIAISGTNIRAILFKKICNGEWSGSGYDRLSIHNVKGVALVNLSRSLLEKQGDLFTTSERVVIERYLIQDTVSNLQ